MTRTPRGPGRPWPTGAALLLPEEDPHAKEHDAASSPVFDLLRHAILHGDLEPGAWLRQTELAEHFEVSRTPVREAFRALEREGLIRLVPHHGAQVVPLSLETFEEIYALRAGVEGLAARKAAEAADEETYEDLSARVAGLEAISREPSVRTYLKAEWELRLACYEVTGRTRLIETIRHLREAAERYLRLAYQADADVRESFQFHHDLVQAIGRNDGDAAERINRKALQRTLDHAWPIVREKVSGAI